MSDNNTLHYGKGIPITSGFDLGAKSPLDSRTVVDNFEELQLHVDGNRAYEGMLVYVNSEKKLYVYNGTGWEELTTNVDADNPIFDVVDNLESTATNAPLSANQGRVLKETINDVEATLETTIRETIGNVEDKLEQLIEEGVGSGNANIHVGTKPPKDTTYMWIDTSAPYNFEVSTHDGRLRLKYIEMLELTKTKLLNIQKDIEIIEKNIEKVTGSEGTDFRIEISRIKSQITIIQNGVASAIQSILSGGDLTNLKITSKNLRRNTKTLSYDLSDINTNVLRVIDGQNQIEDNGGTDNPDTPDNPITPDTIGAILITEDGKQILTEDGLLILLDGVEIESDTIPTNAILAESGLVILTEDGLVILADGMSDATLTDAILTEQGLFILTEDGKYILKN